MESKILIIIFTALLLCSIGPRDISATPTFWDEGSEQEIVSAIISKMNDQELLGQVFMLGYVGQYPHLEFNSWIKKRQIGGVKIFSRNVKTLVSLARDINNMQRSSMQGPFRIPLLVATDQEGGWVNHLKAETSKTAGNLALGATGLLRDSYLTGYYIGQELRQVGINMNFAPTRQCNRTKSIFIRSPADSLPGHCLLQGHEPPGHNLHGQAFSRTWRCG